MKVKEKEFILLAASAVSNFGSALTFIVIVLVLTESFGVASVSYGFLIQTLPAILLSPRLLSRIVGLRRKTVYQTLLTMLGINVLSLCGGQSILRIYLFMMVASVLGAVSTPVINSLISDWVAIDRIGTFQTRVHSLRLAMWAVAPVLGGLLYTSVGPETVFALDAVTFFIGAILISFLESPKAKHLSEPANTLKRSSQAPLIREALHDEGYKAIFVWYALTLVSSILNGIEFAVFARSGFSEREVGFALGAWGAGGIVAFCTTSVRSAIQARTWSIVATLTITTAIFAYSRGPWVIYLSMLAMGAGFSMISGRMRQGVERSLRDASKSLLVWGHIQQRTAVISLLSYLLLGLLLPSALGTELAIVMLPLSLLCLLYLQIGVDRREVVGTRGTV